MMHRLTNGVNEMEQEIVWLGFDSETLILPNDTREVSTRTQVVCIPVDIHIHRGWEWLISDFRRGNNSLMAASRGIPGSAFERDEYRNLEGIKDLQKSLQISEAIRIMVINLTNEPQRFLASMRCVIPNEEMSSEKLEERRCKCYIIASDRKSVIIRSRCMIHC